MADWRKLATLNELSENAPRGVEVDGNPIGLFRVGDDVFALHDVCPHQYALLSSGYQEGEIVECPLHQAIFDVRTGEHLSPPAICGVRSYPVRIEGNDVMVDIAATG